MRLKRYAHYEYTLNRDMLVIQELENDIKTACLLYTA